MKTKDMQIDISRAMSICLRNGVKVYPVVFKSRFKVEVDNNGELIRYDKELTGKELNNALSKTYKHFAKKIILKNANSTKED